MEFSNFARNLTGSSPIVELMEDLGEALNNNPDILFLGGGNPAQVESAQVIFRRHLSGLSSNIERTNRLLGVYQSPQGSERLLDGLCHYFSQDCGWPIARDHIAVVGGSQCAFFILLNLFAGADGGGKKKIALPLVPEYLGYRSQGLAQDHFSVTRPSITTTAPHRFKYGIQFDLLQFGPEIGAVCTSLPTNPSGNLLTDLELQQLLELSQSHGVPLIVDHAYGAPFPGVVYRAQHFRWQPGMVSVLSLSKLGLPGVRTAVVVAEPAVIKMVVQANTIMNLSNGNLGTELLTQLLLSGDLALLSQKLLPDFYRGRRDQLLQAIDTHLSPFPYRVHEPEGAFFVWLWLENLPITSAELYQRLKQRGVLIMAGEPFFFGLVQDWGHARQCLRLTYCQPVQVMDEAMAILADELSQVYG